MSFEANVRFYRLPNRHGRSPLLTHHPRKNTSNDNALKMLLLYLTAFSMISIVYVLYTSQTWSYLGLTLSINLAKLFGSFVILSAFVIATPRAWSARSFFLNIILTTSVIPSLVLYAFSDKPTLSAAVVLSSIVVVYVVSGVRIPRIQILSISPRIMMWVLLAASALFIGAFFLIGGFRYFNLDISRVYEFRGAAAESMPTGFDYLSTTFSNTIIPMGLAISLHYKNNVNAFLFTLLSIIMFGLTSHKVMLFTPFLVIAIFLLLSRSQKYSTILIGFCVLTSLVAASVLFLPYFSADSAWGWIENLFIRRTLMVPAMLDFSYIEFFSKNDQYYWSFSKITFGLLDIPHNGLSAPEMIGLHHFGTTAAWADTGFIGSGFAQAGIFGSIVYAVAVGLTISVFQSFSRDLGIPLIASSTLGLFATMVHASDFVSLFLTYGLLLALIILMSLRK
jgi:hypothetical protein